jgi:hypothetical protein
MGSEGFLNRMVEALGITIDRCPKGDLVKSVLEDLEQLKE